MKKILKYLSGLLIAALLLLVAWGLVSYFGGYTIYRDVSYGEKEANVMDVYIPGEAYRRESNGVILFIHGGSWSGGDKADETIRCRMLASKGYLVANVNYTLWSEETADTYHVSKVLDELDAALLCVQEFANQKGITVDKAATVGYSAGAHLAMLYAYSRAETAPIEIVFTASLAGPADISPEVWGEDMTIRVAHRLTGMEISPEMLRSGEADDVLASISPVSFIDENTPPSLIMQGGKDTVVPPTNADSLVEKFTANAVPYDYVYLKNSDHSLLQNPIQHARYYKTLLEYCRKFFAK
ncbi:MAG: alpha/beta hydrolase [Ruminococcaceae bacterium]|nr:alpha/beta hydrolase [Oscillospiraceae bacterium]